MAGAGEVHRYIHHWSTKYVATLSTGAWERPRGGDDMVCSTLVGTKRSSTFLGPARSDPIPCAAASGRATGGDGDDDDDVFLPLPSVK